MLTNLSTKVSKPNIKVITQASKKHIISQQIGRQSTTRESVKFIKVGGIEIF